MRDAASPHPNDCAFCRETDRCTFCMGLGWLYESTYVQATCPMCKGSGRWVSDKPPAAREFHEAKSPHDLLRILGEKISNAAEPPSNDSAVLEEL